MHQLWMAHNGLTASAGWNIPILELGRVVEGRGVNVGIQVIIEVCVIDLAVHCDSNIETRSS